MKISIMVSTPNAEEICAKAMRGCRSSTPADEIVLSASDVKRLILTALKMGHESVLEHACITFEIAGVSRACTHQLVRHRLASYSQQSGRATKLGETLIPDTIQELMKKDEDVEEFVREFMSDQRKLKDMLKNYDIPLEDIRYFDFIGSTSNIVVTMNLRELRHFFKLRTAPAAQWEIRQMATEMLKLSKKIAPTVFEDFP